MDDVTLTFNPEPFLKGMESITGKLDEMQQGFQNFSKTGVQKAQKVTAGIGTMMKGMAVFHGTIAMVKKGMAQIPEVGRTFSIAGDIMMRNFLWPLRKELIPMLQKLLDWVRDNRAMFVKWGQVVANIFRAIVSIVKSVLRVLKGMWERISKGIEQVFGKSINSMTELVNIALFKITALVEFILITLQPVFDFIANMFVIILKSAKQFFKGLMEGMGDIMPEFGRMWDSLKRIANALGLANTKGNVLIKTFRILGNVIGMVVGPIIRALGQTIDTIALGIEKLSIVVQKFRTNDKREKARLDKEWEGLKAEYKQRTAETWGRQWDAWKSGASGIKKTWRGEVTPKGEITAPPANNNAVVDNRKQTTNITVNESKTPMATAEAVDKKTRDILRESRYKAGSR